MHRENTKDYKGRYKGRGPSKSRSLVGIVSSGGVSQGVKEGEVGVVYGEKR